MKKSILIFAIILSLFGCQKKQSIDYSELDTNKNINISSKTKEKEHNKMYESAIVKAKIYSKHMYMSKDAIYKQLTASHGDNYPEDAATYAIENINVDYNKNALKKAEFYRNQKNMSIEEIKEKLSSKQGDNFTEEEAMYAIDNLE